MSIAGQKRAPKENESKFLQYEVLLNLAGAISRADGPQEIYRTATQGLVHALVADRAAILIFDEDDVMRFKEWVGVSDEHRAAVEGHITWERGARDPQPITVSDVMQDSSLSAYRHVFAKEGIRSLAFIPLMAEGGLIGKLTLYYNTPHEFQPDELRVVQVIAGQVALAAERRSAQTALRESEERFRSTFFQAAVGITQCSANGEWLLVNDRFCEIVGYTRAELQGKTVFDLTHPDDRETCVVAINRLMAGEISSYSAEKRYIRKDGAVIWAKLFVNPVRAADGKMQYFIGVVEDITEKVKAERARQDSEQRLRLAMSTGLGVWEYDLLSGAATVSPRYGEILGHATLTHAHWLELVHPEDRERVLALIRESIDRVSDWDAEFRLGYPDGSVSWVISKGTVLLGDDGRPAHVAGVSLDITQRKATEEALRLSQERLELAQEVGGIGVWGWDVTTGETHCSSGHGPLYGLPPGTLLPPVEEWLERLYPEDRPTIREELSQALKYTDHFGSEFRVVWPDGTIHWLYNKGQVFRDSQGNPIRVIGVNMDISERKRDEVALRESEERFRIMADTAPVMICVSGPDKLAIFFNAGWLGFTGRTMDQELGYGWTEGVHPDDLDECLASYSASFDARRNCHLEYRLCRADGEYRSVVCNGVPRFEDGVFAGYIATCIDITDAKRAHDETLARQKLESLGVLASGIAHDFNNLLGGILTSSEIALAGRLDGLPIEEELQRIRTAAIRGGEIVRQLMIYGGEKSLAFEPVDVSSIIEEMVQLLKVSISKHAILKIDLGKNIPAVQANPSQIRQVVMNLVTNASEAIGENPGVIRIRTSLARAGVSLGKEVAKLPEGDYVQMEVSDNGPGMTPEVQAKVFDLFFTTKFAGRGLGLAVTQRIVHSHGGVIQVNSSGQGASVQVWLPCTVEAAQETKLAPPGKQKPVSRPGRILVVEDEDLLRLAVSKGLEKRGFSVMQARDGTAAINLIRAHANDIDVVLLDLTLPGTSSREILEEVGRTRSEQKVILTSAYGREAVEASLAGLRVERFIQKPFQLAELVNELQEALAD